LRNGLNSGVEKCRVCITYLVGIALVSGARAFISVGVQISLLAPDFQGFSLKVFFTYVAKNVAMLFTFTAILLVK